ncbi:MAG: hypothetical protein K0B01_00590 [Syntrophobacterales bacterium]|nr:hypothetical protein [Syntrophobacterales bacterium]
MTLEIGTVFRWDNFPLPRYGDETKARWFIYLGETGPFAQIAIIYLVTTTTQTAHFQPGGNRYGHSHFQFEARQFPAFEKDCIIDFNDPPYPIEKARFANKQSDLSVKGKLREDAMRMIYNRFLQAGSCSKMVMLDIHESFNKAGIAALKKPK